MMSKFSAMAAIVAISILGFSLPAANAQPGEPALPFGDGNYLDPWMNCRVWAGYNIKDKDASGLVDENGEATGDQDTYLGYTGGGTEVGLKLKKGKLLVQGSLSTSFNSVDGDAGKALGVNVRYSISDDLFVHYGNGGDPNMSYKGDQPWAASPADDGFRGYGVGGGQTMIDVGYKGAYLGFFVKGYNSLSQFDNSSSNDTVDYTIPRMVVGYQYSGPVSIGIAGLYQSKKIDNPTITTTTETTTTTYEPVYENSDGTGNIVGYYPVTTTSSTDSTALNPLDGESIVSYAMSFNLGYMAGPIHAAAHAYYQQNGSEMGFFPPGSLAEVDSTDPSKIANTTQMGGNFVIAYRAGSMEPCAGVAYKVTSNDNWEKDDASMAYFFRVKLDITPGFNIQPGIIITDNMKSGGTKGDPDSVVTEGKTTQFGVFLETTI